MNPRSILVYEYHSPHVDAPVWPWSLAGHAVATLWLLLLVLAWLGARG